MQNLILEIAALMLAAYFLGAMVACFVRRIFFVPRADAPLASTAQWQTTPLKPAPVAAGAPVIEVGKQHAPSTVNTDSNRFERALTQAPEEVEPSSPKPSSPEPDKQPVTEKMQTIETPPERPWPPEPETLTQAEPETPTRAEPENKPQAEPADNPETTSATPSEGYPMAAAAAAAAAASNIAVAFQDDDVKRVASIVPRRSAPAQPKPSTTPEVAQETEVVVEKPAPAVDEPAVSVSAPVKPVPVGLPQDLRRIREVDLNLATLLNNHGLHRYEQIAALSGTQIEALENDLGMPGRIRRDSWVPQAEILAKSGETTYTRGRGAHGSKGQNWASRSIAEDPTERIPKPLEAAAAHPTVARKRTGAEQAVVAAAAIAAATAAANRTTGVLERRPRWEQENSEDHETKASLSLPSSVSANEPSSEPRPTQLSEAIRDNAEQVSEHTEQTKVSQLSGLRSIRSEALRGTENQSDGHDDLKRIRGIGVLVEKKLNSIGINSFAQIAEWTKDDIKRVSGQLDFQGRIEREHWIEQAKLLTS